jgi:hypothetical protein
MLKYHASYEIYVEEGLKPVMMFPERRVIEAVDGAVAYETAKVLERRFFPAAIKERYPKLSLGDISVKLESMTIDDGQGNPLGEAPGGVRMFSPLQR